VRFDGWTEHFRYDLWTKAFETEGIPKESYLRAYDLDEILPWDVLDVSIKKRWLQIELIKAKKEMRTEDCKWGHCYACGVPGNGEDTMLAKAMPGDALPVFDASPRAPRTARRRCPSFLRRRSARRRATRSSVTASRSRKKATRAFSPTATPWTSSSARSGPPGCRRATRRASTRT
jgi:hypothetical protein